MPRQILLGNSETGPLALRRMIFAIVVLSLILSCCLCLVGCLGNGMSPGAATGTLATLSTTSLNFGKSTIGASGTPKILSILNSSNAYLLISSITLTGSNAKDFTQTNDCGGALTAGASCFVKVAFKPAASGTRLATMSISDNPGNPPQIVNLSGTGTSNGPAVTLSAPNFYFGSYPLGVSGGPQNLRVTSSGNAPLTISALTLSGADSTDFSQTNNCGGSLAAGANCLIQVKFKPSAVGIRATTLTLTDNATPGRQTVIFSGSGTSSSKNPDTGSGPAANLSSTSLSFSSKADGTASAAQTILLSNSGNTVMNIYGIALTGANPGNFTQSNNCGSSVAAGASCSIRVTFSSTASGSRTASLAVTDDAPASPQVVSLSGSTTTATTGAAASLSPTSLTFANLGIAIPSPAQVVTLTNSGTSTLTISSVTILGTNAGDFIENSTCGTSLAASAHCTIVVLFTPLALGARSATLSVSDNAKANPQTVSLVGGGSHDVVLTWSASPSTTVMGYNVYRGTTAGGESYTPLNSTPINGTTYVDADVTAGTEYFYVLTSVTSGAVESGRSNETSVTVP